MEKLVEWTIDWPARMASGMSWTGPLLGRLVVGEVFMTSGWIKLHNLPQMVENFTGWGIPFPQLTTPFVSMVELVGGVLLLLGFYTRLAAIPLAVVMIVAIATVLWPDVDSLDSLLGLSESAYLAIFLWLAAVGPGLVSVDHWLQKRFGRDRE